MAVVNVTFICRLLRSRAFEFSRTLVPVLARTTATDEGGSYVTGGALSRSRVNTHTHTRVRFGRLRCARTVLCDVLRHSCSARTREPSDKPNYNYTGQFSATSDRNSKPAYPEGERPTRNNFFFFYYPGQTAKWRALYRSCTPRQCYERWLVYY